MRLPVPHPWVVHLCAAPDRPGPWGWELPSFHQSCRVHPVAPPCTRGPRQSVGPCNEAPPPPPPWGRDLTSGPWKAQEGPQDPAPLPGEGPKGCPHVGWLGFMSGCAVCLVRSLLHHCSKYAARALVCRSKIRVLLLDRLPRSLPSLAS